MSLLKISGMRLALMEAFKLPIDLVTTSGIEDNFKKEIEGTEVLIYDVSLYDFGQ